MLRFGFVAQDLVDAGRLQTEEICQLRKTTDTWDDVPCLTDDQLAMFLLSCCRDQDATAKTIRSYFTARKKWPQLFDSRNLEREDIARQLEVLRYGIFPQRTEDNCCIIYHRLFDTTYYNYCMQPAMKILFMILDAAIYDNPPDGLIILFDMKGVGLMHLTRTKLDLIKAFFYYLQEALPVRLRSIHVLNAVYFLDKVMSIIKPFIKAEVLEHVHFHSTSMNMDEFYEKWIPKRCLPEDYGGELSSVDILHKDAVKKLDQMKQHFDDEEKQRHSK